MAIDHPLSAARNQLEAEERQNPLGLSRKLATLFAEFLPGTLSGLVKSALDRDASDRLRYLFDVLEQEFEYMQHQLEQLEACDDNYRHFLVSEFPSLLHEGFRKAEATRAKSRIRRIAAILGNSIRSSTLAAPDEVEDFLYIATQLSERDVYLLREIGRLHGNFVSGDGKRLSSRTWADADLMRFGMGVPDVFEIGPKLESFGLVRETDESRRGIGPPKPWPYALLPKGVRFIASIQLRAIAETDPDPPAGDHSA